MQDWPLRELLICYLARIRAQLVEVFRHRQTLYQMAAVMGAAKGRPPEPPRLIREEGGE